MKTKEKQVSYKNPWSEYEVFKRENVTVEKSDCGRGMIVKYVDNFYEYVIDGLLVSQRCGSSIESLKLVIDCINGLFDKSELNSINQRAVDTYYMQKQV